MLAFNFIALNEVIDAYAFGHFALQLILIMVVSLLGTVSLSYLLSKIDHHIKFLPMVLLVVLIYAVSKVYHLPGLVFILIFGLAIGNIDELKRFRLVQYFRPEELKQEVKKLNSSTFAWALGIVAVIYLIRLLQMKLQRIPLQPLLLVAPRGLITILLFLSIEPARTIAIVNKSLIIQVIILTALAMMLGLISSRAKPADAAP
ncbi:MAG: hypothetical protein MUF62_06490 [Chitinophagaceae bacterium]|nr:hypothetical protein [Chitinophagaceae bacterium]